MVTDESFIEDAQRAEIQQKYASLSVDMETASIAYVCYVNPFPFLFPWTITDPATYKGIESFERNCQKSSEISDELTLGFLDRFYKNV